MEIKITKTEFENDIVLDWKSWEKSTETLTGSKGDLIINVIYYYFDKDGNKIGKWTKGKGTTIPVFNPNSVSFEDEVQIKREHSLKLMFDEDFNEQKDKTPRLYSKYLRNKYGKDIFVSYNEDGEIVKYDQQGY